MVIGIHDEDVRSAAIGRKGRGMRRPEEDSNEQGRLFHGVPRRGVSHHRFANASISPIVNRTLTMEQPTSSAR